MIYNIKNLKKMIALDYSTTAAEIENLKTGDRVSFKHNAQTGGIYSVTKETENQFKIICLNERGLFFEVNFLAVI